MGAPAFAPDYSTTGLAAAKMWTNSQWAFYVYYISMAECLSTSDMKIIDHWHLGKFDDFFLGLHRHHWDPSLLLIMFSYLNILAICPSSSKQACNQLTFVQTPSTIHVDHGQTMDWLSKILRLHHCLFNTKKSTSLWTYHCINNLYINVYGC